jgi:hypothetical protein
LLADAIDAGSSGRQPIEDALTGYEQQRNRATFPIYGLTCQFASLQPPPPEQQQLTAALRGNQDATDRFIGTLAGSVSIAEFFAPENIGRIIGAAEQQKAA